MNRERAKDVQKTDKWNHRRKGAWSEKSRIFWPLL